MHQWIVLWARLWQSCLSIVPGAFCKQPGTRAAAPVMAHLPDTVMVLSVALWSPQNAHSGVGTQHIQRPISGHEVFTCGSYK